MGDDDDMVKKVVHLGRTLERCENGLSVRPDRRHVRSLLRELRMESSVEESPRHFVPPWRRKEIEVTVRR